MIEHFNCAAALVLAFVLVTCAQARLAVEPMMVYEKANQDWRGIRLGLACPLDAVVPRCACQSFGLGVLRRSLLRQTMFATQRTPCPRTRLVSTSGGPYPANCCPCDIS